MKKAIYLCLMLAVMPFISCSSDDDNGDSNLIVGSWISTTSHTDRYEDGVKTEELDEIYDDLSFNSLTFNTNKSVTKVEYYNGEQGEPDNATYTTEGNKLTFHYTNSGVEVSQKSTFSINGNTLIVVSEFEEVEKGITYKEVYTDTYVRQ